MPSNDDIRAYLTAQHDVEQARVRNGNELSPAAAGEYHGQDFSWLVYSTEAAGWVFVGEAREIAKELHNYSNRPQ